MGEEYVHWPPEKEAFNKLLNKQETIEELKQLCDQQDIAYPNEQEWEKIEGVALETYNEELFDDTDNSSGEIQ
ncbi:MAG: hypothetical protein HYZ51_00630 [Candidatus Doudnabacteria bacterium]|nr:hypothetical protein [Candidatus Doudnabacteria bacterium]